MAIIRRSQAYSPNEIKPVLYSDSRTDFIFHPNKKDLVMDVNEDSVKTSIKNLLLTRRGERVFNPLLGSNIFAVLFENITTQTTLELRNYIVSTIENFEPRAKIMSVDVTPYTDENGYFVSIVFTTINKSEPIVLDLVLDRIR